MNVPFFSLKRSFENHKKEILSTVENTFNNQTFVGGETVAIFEKNLSTYLKSSYAIGCNSGTDALWMALHAVNIKPKSLVITTPFSFIASSSEIVSHGAIPLFVDIENDSYNVCPHAIETFLKQECHQINKQTIHTQTNLPVIGILTVDLFGQLANYNAIQPIADEWNLWIIEDACQAIGAHKDGKYAGTFGTIGTFSFYPTKNLGAYGDGGALATNDSHYYKHLMQLKNHGRSSHYNYEFLGINSRLDSIQAALLTEQLKQLDERISLRKQHAKQYHDGLAHQKHLALPQEIYGSHSYHQYSIRLTSNSAINDRNTLINLLAQKGVETRVFYPETLDSISFLQTDDVQKRACPKADLASKTILSLPIWPELTKNEIDFVICATLESLDELYKPKVYQPSMHQIQL